MTDNGRIVRLEPDGPGIGQKADGSLDSFPLSELDAKTRERALQEQATDYAVAQSEAGFPEDETEAEPGDVDQLAAEYADRLGQPEDADE